MCRILKVLGNKKGLLSGEGAVEEMILAAERELNLSFSDEYREYLKHYGIVAYCGHELTGLTKTARLSVVEVTKAERAKDPEIPTDLYVIEGTNVEEIVMWQSAEGKIYCSAPNMKLREYCASLSDYIEQ